VVLGGATSVPVYYTDRSALQSMGSPILVAGYSIAACRLYLHLKRSRLRDLRTTDFANAMTPTLGVISMRERREEHPDDSWSDSSGDERRDVDYAASATSTSVDHARSRQAVDTRL